MIKTIKYIGIVVCVFFFVSQDGMAATLTADRCNYSCSPSYICRRGSSDDKYWPGNRYSSNCGGSCRSGYTCQSYYVSCTSPCYVGTLCTNNSTIPAPSYTCTYISSYSSWTACNNNVQYGIGPNWNTVTSSSSSCSDAASSRWCPSTPGTCNSASSAARIYDSTASTWVGGWCSSGTASFPNGVPSFPDPGETTVSWSCLGSGGGTNTTNCQASRKFNVPNADLSINGVGVGVTGGNVSVNRDTGSLNMAWLTNATNCTKNGVSWGTGQLTPTSGSATIGPFQSGPYPRSDVYSINCWNSNGNNLLDSAPVGDNVRVNIVCTPGDTWSGCPKECGLPTETESGTRTAANCTTSSLGTRNCNYDPCPVSSEWKEVQP